ncbi:MAG: BrnT family toxin [Nostocales cyanobacterium 94392]|nr:BrnT family toxin [Nostocales cyanobacterium 94392]
MYNRAYYNGFMEYEWDTNKAQSNHQKHDNEHPDEERFVSVGIDALSRILVFVYT